MIIELVCYSEVENIAIDLVPLMLEKNCGSLHASCPKNNSKNQNHRSFFMRKIKGTRSKKEKREERCVRRRVRCPRVGANGGLSDAPKKWNKRHKKLL